MIAGCRTNDAASSADDAGLVFWAAMTPDEIETLRAIADDYRAERGVTVTVREIGLFEINTKLELAAPAGRGPDLVSVSHTSVGVLSLMGLLLPLDRAVLPLSGCPPDLVDAFGYDAVLYGAPLTVESYGLVVNEGLLSEVPETLEELLDTARRLTVDTDGDGETDVYGFLTDPANFYFTFPFYDVYGGYIFSETDEGAVDPTHMGLCTPGGIEGLTLLFDIAGPTGFIPRGIDYPIIGELFGENRVAMMIHGVYLIPSYRSLGMNVGYHPIPPAESGRRARPLANLMGIGVSAHSENPESALDFLAYLLEPSRLRLIFEGSGAIKVMANPLVYREEDFAQEPLLAAAVEIAGTSYPYPNDPAGELVWDAVGAAATAVMDGTLSPEEALCRMEERIETVIEEMRR
ncbi:MAG: extracellular solute-binding protein [Deltaproteobacteria bacterium]|nr:extracellular solute-binding protein [Candidatus Zymogenaceae bacterium]